MEKEKIGAEWKALDNKYDNLIQELIDAPEPVLLTEERMSELRAMQDRLFSLETELFKILRG